MFWHLLIPPYALAAAFAKVYQRVLPEVPMYHGILSGADSYEPLIVKADNAMRASDDFEAPERIRVEASQVYTREAWLDYVPTMGGHSRLTANELAALLDGIGAAIDVFGGEFTSARPRWAWRRHEPGRSAAVKELRTARPSPPFLPLLRRGRSPNPGSFAAAAFQTFHQIAVDEVAHHFLRGRVGG